MMVGIGRVLGAVRAGLKDRLVGRSVDLVGTSKPTRAQARIATEWGIELSSGFA